MNAKAAKNRTTIRQFHARVLRDTFGGPVDDRDAFLLFMLFHLSRVELTGPVLSDRPVCTDIAAITQRHCGAALAALWRGRDDPRADYMHWYWRWNAEWQSYAHADNLNEDEAARLRVLT
jgi:hypothetical protein